MHTSTLGLGVPKWLYLAVLCVNTPKPTFLISVEITMSCITDVFQMTGVFLMQLNES